MNRQRKLDNLNSESYQSMLPEIANILNISVSSIEKYPTDIQKVLCNIYTDNYHSDQITIKQALGRVVQLNTETEKQIEHSEQQESNQEQERKKLSAQALLSREQILKNAKIITEKNQQRNYQQAQSVEYDGHLELKKTKTNNCLTPQSRAIQKGFFICPK